ncbi:hypothetical protein HGRIS_009342 [Hohenbuehelia grisea]|uniref:Uncharacterized protein n=1 Tax=Hohenbuehelia grisea TaxID=104357 RepID=A0ABR3J0W5_9AGAR
MAANRRIAVNNPYNPSINIHHESGIDLNSRRAEDSAMSTEEDFIPLELLARMSLDTEARLVAEEAMQTPVSYITSIPTIKVVPPATHAFSTRRNHTPISAYNRATDPRTFPQVPEYPGSTQPSFDFVGNISKPFNRSAIPNTSINHAAAIQTQPPHVISARPEDPFARMACIFDAAAQDADTRNPSRSIHTSENPNWACAPDEDMDTTPGPQSIPQKRGRPTEVKRLVDRQNPQDGRCNPTFSPPILNPVSGVMHVMEDARDEPTIKRRKPNQGHRTPVRQDSRTPDGTRRPKLDMRIIENHLRLNSPDGSSSRSRSTTPIRNRSPLSDVHQQRTAPQRGLVAPNVARAGPPKTSKAPKRPLPRVRGRGRPFQADPYSVFNAEFEPLPVPMVEVHSQEYPLAGFPVDPMHMPCYSSASTILSHDRAIPPNYASSSLMNGQHNAPPSNHPVYSTTSAMSSPPFPANVVDPSANIMSRIQPHAVSAPCPAPFNINFATPPPPPPPPPPQQQQQPNNAFKPMLPNPGPPDQHAAQFSGPVNHGTRHSLERGFTFRSNSSILQHRPRSEPQTMDPRNIPRNSNLSAEEYMQLLQIATGNQMQGAQAPVQAARLQALPHIDRFGNVAAKLAPSVHQPETTLEGRTLVYETPRPSSAPDSGTPRATKTSGGSVPHRQPGGPTDGRGFSSRGQKVENKTSSAFAELLRNRHGAQTGRG